MSQSIPLNCPKRSGAGGDERAKVSGWDLGRPSVRRRAALLDPWDDPLVTHAGGMPVDLNVLPNVPMSLESSEPVLASWSQRVLASVLDSAIGAGATFLAFGDQSVTVPFIGAQFGSVVRPDMQGVPAASFNDSGWVLGAVLLMVVMQSYVGVTPGKLVVGIAVVRDVDARPIGLAGTTLRWLAHILDSILFIGYLRPLWNAQRKTFADSIMATVVVDTRRPRRHRWFTRGGCSSLDPGPPRSWEAPSAPRWRRPATAFFAVVCAAGVLLSLGPSSGQTRGPFDVSCAMTAPDNGPLGLTGGTLSSSSATGTSTRLGVTRPVGGSKGQIRATWEWSSPEPVAGNVTLRASFAGAGSSSVRHYDYPAPIGAFGGAVFALPADALTGLGDSWTWTQTILVDGVESQRCTAPV